MFPARGEYAAAGRPDGACRTARRTGTAVGGAAEDDAFYGLYFVSAAVLSGDGVARVHCAGDRREVGVCSVVVAVALSERGVYAIVHVADGLGDQSASQRHLPVEYGSAGCVADCDDGWPLASGYCRDGMGLHLIKYNMGVCVAFLRQEADGVWTAGVLEGYRAVCAGCGWRDACHVFRNTGNFSPLAEIAMSCCYCHATLLRRDALSRGSHPERGDRILYSRPKRCFLRKGLTRSSWEVMTQKATTTRATARAAVVSRMKL